MTAQEIGSIIKEARLSKKMTQNEVVGDFITRNMLSQIENGNATPSIKTLQYLAQKLDLSLSQFSLTEEIDDTDRDTDKESNTLADWENIKQDYNNKDYDSCLSHIPVFLKEKSALYDEACALSALCYLQLASTHVKKGSVLKAMEYAKKAGQYAGLGIYKNQQIITESVLLLSDLASRTQSH